MRALKASGRIALEMNPDKPEYPGLMLEDGDTITVPIKPNFVAVFGSVLAKTSFIYRKGDTVGDYINRAGGFTQTADNARVVIARRDGSFEQTDASRMLTSAPVRPGDQVLVLPKVDEKKRQFWKDMTQIIYQIAVSAKVVFGL